MALAAPDPVPATVILQQMIEVEVVSLLYGDGKGMDYGNINIGLFNQTQ